MTARHSSIKSALLTQAILYQLVLPSSLSSRQTTLYTPAAFLLAGRLPIKAAKVSAVTINKVSQKTKKGFFDLNFCISLSYRY